VTDDLPDLIGLAFAAGLVAALNPCGFAMLPAYLTFVVSGAERSRPAAVGRAALATVAMTAGFVAVFAAFGLLAVSIASRVQRYIPAVTVVVGIALLVAGIWMLSGRQLRLAIPGGFERAPTARMGLMFGYGVAYAVTSLSCTVGPFLAVTASATRIDSNGGAVVFYGAYAAGFALVVGTLAVAAAFTSAALSARLRNVLPVINRIGGFLVILVGLYVAYYGTYELRLLHGYASTEDTVISVAGRVQSAVAGWVHSHGGWPWVLALSVLAAFALTWAWRRRGGSR
jgi:cytochrome c biogenesis protein CcdA